MWDWLGGWVRKFGHAIRGLRSGAAGQQSFWVHIPAAMLVVGLIWGLGIEAAEGCVLILCIGVVLAAEYFNASIELLVRRLHPQRDEQIGRALDAAAAGVLVLSLAAAACGVWILGLAAWRWWQA